MIKRLFDIFAATIGLLVLCPLLITILILVWYHDKRSPIYMAERAALGGRRFLMLKVRSMIVDADKNGVESTSAADTRITPVGHFIRRYKLDEFLQLWNVLKGEMSLVGPRPNTLREVAKYTPSERQLLNVRPGITDIASIVFSDEGEILKNEHDADIAYNLMIRPWKSRLGILYVENVSLFLDMQIIKITLQSIFCKSKALDAVSNLVRELGAPEDLINIAARQTPLLHQPSSNSEILNISSES